MDSHELLIENYPDLLDELQYSSEDIKSKVTGFKLDFPQNRNPEVEHGLKIPIFVTPFYDCIQHLKIIPKQEIAWGYYLAYHQENIEDLKRSDLTDDIRARFNRTYPSLMRDFHFNKYIKEHLPEGYRALYNTTLDVEEGIDLLIISPHANYGICFFTDTNAGNNGRKWKEKRHHYAENVIFIEMPLNLSKADKCGDFLLYGEEQYQKLWDKIMEYESQYIRILPLYTSVPESKQYISCLPFYEVKVACGSFIDGGIPEEVGWIDVTAEGLKGNTNRFVVRASGHYMEPKIHDGDLCVFERNWAGTRNGHIVLAQSRDFDPDYSGKYTIKKYHSEAMMTDDWEVEKSIDLIPLNPDYEVIHATEEDEIVIVGVLVGIIEGGQLKEIDELVDTATEATIKPEHIGYCIHCGEPIAYTYGNDKPAYYCKKCWREWYNAGQDKNTSEVHCHRCGQKRTPKYKNAITFNYPICEECWKKNR